PRPTPAIRSETLTYVVQPGDSLGRIAARFAVGPQNILTANGLGNPNVLSVGQVLMIPPPVVDPPGPSNKILPDSELIYGPASADFDLSGFTSQWPSYLVAYYEEVEGNVLRGPEIVQLVAQRYSVNSRVLLAVLEDHSGWVRASQVAGLDRTYPMGYVRAGWEGLFSQLSWAADQLNSGYYLWKAGWNGPFVLEDGASVIPGSGLNAGTVSLQFLFAQWDSSEAWRLRLAPDAFPLLYTSLFGSPFRRAVEPLVPEDLQQPVFRLPMEDGTTWSFTSGPHAGWGSGAAWAALDFAPPGDALGCVYSQEWVTAVADGLIVRSDHGEVLQDLDGDGLEGTGWVVLYMHVGENDRVGLGEYVRSGDRIGHPSCEGGISNGTHVHLARRYNGEWIPADGILPFVMDGWVSAGEGTEYDGTMTRGDVVLEACGCRAAGNQISR
ncbi:MAG: LysM peptidoglycan-binding domain-containing protein, partial [Anaerolineales bacterium]